MKAMIMASAVGITTMFAPEEPLKEMVHNKMLMCRELACSDALQNSPNLKVYFAGMAAAYQDVYISLMDDDE